MLEDPDEVDQSVDPGTVNLLMDSPVLSVLEAAAAVVGALRPPPASQSPLQC